jgi:hypothetical protein
MAAGQHDPVRSRVRKGKTQGVSPKAVLATLLPALGTLLLAILDQVVGPNIDVTLKIAIVGAVNAALAALGAYLGDPGDVRYPAGA